MSYVWPLPSFPSPWLQRGTESSQHCPRIVSEMDGAPSGPLCSNKGRNRLDHQRAEEQPPQHRVGSGGPRWDHQYPSFSVVSGVGSQECWQEGSSVQTLSHRWEVCFYSDLSASCLYHDTFEVCPGSSGSLALFFRGWRVLHYPGRIEQWPSLWTLESVCWCSVSYSTVVRVQINFLFMHSKIPILVISVHQFSSRHQLSGLRFWHCLPGDSMGCCSIHTRCHLQTPGSDPPTSCLFNFQEQLVELREMRCLG